MVDFIDKNKQEYGVEPICRYLPIASSTYYKVKELEAYPEKRSKRSHSDEALMVEINRIWMENYCCYGVLKVWYQLLDNGFEVARCTVGRLMRKMGLRGVSRGKSIVTTRSDKSQKSPSDLVKREFRAIAPDMIWIADFTYVKTSKGFVYVAFIIDVYSRMIVGWQISQSLQADFVLDALEQAILSRNPSEKLIHHSDKGVQYLSIRYTRRLREEGIRPSTGRTGDSYDNAMAERIIGLYKAELIYPKGKWEGPADVEFETLKYVDWFNNRRLMGTIGYITPRTMEARFNRESSPKKRVEFTTK